MDTRDNSQMIAIMSLSVDYVAKAICEKRSDLVH